MGGGGPGVCDAPAHTGDLPHCCQRGSLPIDWVRHSFAAAQLLPIFFYSPPDFTGDTFSKSPPPPYLLRVLNSPLPSVSLPSPRFNPLPEGADEESR
ncbi:hypothetical protein AVEN_40257-1 [Araneus ventricosus]|uniref:Uncharacterized protein n=1 Tax=Araneus ventricosus TaxID=182803 RepID=A0A4Y2PNF1_ARAVE|nr:hypothetical protein AVEN_40257-1 [Araneus ventricosus]